MAGRTCRGACPPCRRIASCCHRCGLSGMGQNHSVRRGMALAALLALTGCGLIGGESKHTMRGTIVSPECGGGYDVESAQVVVDDQAGNIIGTGHTSTDVIAPLRGLGWSCVVRFTVADVPD